MGKTFTENSGAKIVEEYNSIQPHWCELFLGPIHFRKSYDEGQYFEAEDIQTILEKYQYSKACRMSIGLHDGLLRFEWGQSYGTFEPLHTYDDFIGYNIENDRNSPEVLTYHLGDFPESMSNEALKVMQGAIDFCSKLMQEFENALNEGSCQVWARSGGDAIPFRKVSPELFSKYKIESWGQENKVGQALAVRDFEPSLFAIQVSLNDDFIKGDEIHTSGLGVNISKPDTSDNMGKAIERFHNRYIELKEEYSTYEDKKIWDIMLKDIPFHGTDKSWGVSVYKRIKTGEYPAANRRNFKPIKINVTDT